MIRFRWPWSTGPKVSFARDTVDDVLIEGSIRSGKTMKLAFPLDCVELRDGRLRFFASEDPDLEFAQVDDGTWVLRGHTLWELPDD